MGQIIFGVPTELVLALQRWTAIRAFVETGTNEGNTSRWASAHFDRVFTIEGFEPLFKKVSTRRDAPSNVSYLFGDSRARLPEVMTQLDAPAVFWLDAHWCGEQTFGATGECPVLEEVEIVNAGHPDHVVLVDDARLFTAPPPAPHRAQDWPDLAKVCALMSTPERPRNVIIYKDVIVGVPERYTDHLVAFLRESETARLQTLENRSFVDRARGALGRLLTVS